MNASAKIGSHNDENGCHFEFKMASKIETLK
jgi:hypothetical protein